MAAHGKEFLTCLPETSNFAGRPGKAGGSPTATSPWFRYFLTYDPLPALRAVDQPVLALIGEKDLQVPAQANLDAIRDALTAGGNDDFETVELPSLNHLFQTAETGSPTEYATIEETMSPRALRTMSDWILARFPGPTP